MIVSCDLSTAPYRWPRAAISRSFSSSVEVKIEEEVAAALGVDLEVAEEERL